MSRHRTKRACPHESCNSYVVPRARAKSPAVHHETASLWWRVDWCTDCGALRTWSGPAESDAGPWLPPQRARSSNYTSEAVSTIRSALESLPFAAPERAPAIYEQIEQALKLLEMLRTEAK